MTAPRFQVTTVEGFLGPMEGRNGREPGLSAHVVDTFYAHRVVATFRSETRLWKRTRWGGIAPRESVGREAALAAAQCMADIFNVLDS